MIHQNQIKKKERKCNVTFVIYCNKKGKCKCNTVCNIHVSIKINDSSFTKISYGKRTKKHGEEL